MKVETATPAIATIAGVAARRPRPIILNGVFGVNYPYYVKYE